MHIFVLIQLLGRDLNYLLHRSFNPLSHLA